jgi:Iap family predicted aminopeptidase
MKKEHVIKNQTSGIKWYRHVESHVGVDLIISQAIEIATDHPNVWVSRDNPNRWDNVHWAFGNAFREIYDDPKYKVPARRNNGQSAFNLDEVLTDAQIQYIKERLNIVEPYTDTWKRS